MSTITVVLFDKARSDGKFPVRLRVGKDRKYSYETLCYIKANHWNDTAKQVHTYEPNSVKLNALIRKRLKDVNDLVEQYELRSWPYTPSDILSINYEQWKVDQQKTKLTAKSDVPGGFIAYMKEIYIVQWKKNGNLGNAEKYEIEVDLFSTFLKTLKPKRVDIPMSSFTVELIQLYFEFLRSKDKPCRKDSTLRRKLAQIEAVLRYAHKKGALATIPELEINFDLKKANKPKLTKRQIEILETHIWDFSSVTNRQYLQSAQNVQLAVQTFLMQFYLFGARVGDILMLTNSNVKTVYGKPVQVEYYQQKGQKSEGKQLMSIKINPKLMPIVEEYWDPKKPDQYLLPWLRNRYEFDFTLNEAQNKYQLKYAVHQATSTINQALKRACMILDLDIETLASHSARHSYAQMAKRKGKSIEFIKESLGHSTYDVTANYLTELDKDELNENLQDVYD